MRPATQPTPANLATDALAAYRLTRLVTRDWITDGIRSRARAALGDGTADFLACPWCVGVWVAAAVTAARALLPEAWQWPARGLSAAAIVGLADVWAERA